MEGDWEIKKQKAKSKIAGQNATIEGLPQRSQRAGDGRQAPRAAGAKTEDREREKGKGKREAGNSVFTIDY